MNDRIEPSVIFCDLDGTLISLSSELVFVRGLFRRKILSFSALWGFFRHYMRHPLRTVKEGKGWNRGYLKGLSPETVAEQAAIDLAALLDSVRPEVLEVLRHHAERGAEVCILSASLSPVVEAVTKALGFHCFRGSIPEISNGRLTGNLLGHRPWGRAKVPAAEALLDQFGKSWKDAMALGDSWSDRHVMEACRYGTAVAPGGRLRKLALKNNWRIIEK